LHRWPENRQWQPHTRTARNRSCSPRWTLETDYGGKLLPWKALGLIALATVRVPGQVVLPVMANNLRNGFCIFIGTFCQGPVPVVSDDERYVVFEAELEAQKEIVDKQMTRLHQFLDGEREFEDAIEVEEYVVPVTVHPDGVITDAEGNSFGPEVM